MGNRMVRQGQYAIVNGVEYAARVRGGGKVLLFIPRSGAKPDGWDFGANNTWSREVDASEVSDAFSIRTSATLDDVEVYVDVVNITDRTAVVRALESTGSHERDPQSPHPLLEPYRDSPYSIDWVAKVPWERLTNVDEGVGRIDPATGRRISEEPP
jgi:hypothetical protein